MSPAWHTTHNPRHRLGLRLVWREISTGETTPTQDSARAESGARADWQLAPLTPFYSIIVPFVQFFGQSSCLLWQPWFVRLHVSYDSPNLLCGPSDSVRTWLTGVRSEPGHRTHLTSLILYLDLKSVKWKLLVRALREFAAAVHSAAVVRSGRNGLIDLFPDLRWIEWGFMSEWFFVQVCSAQESLKLHFFSFKIWGVRNF